MGLAAGQARLLSITARLTDNEQVGQAISFAKQRLADETDQISRAYNEALSATKLTVLTGFAGTEAQYEDISYGLMTGYNTVAAGKQYLVADAKGRILVTDKLAKAYEDGNGDFNYFLAHVDDTTSGQKVNYSQCDLDLTTRKSEKNIQAVHEAWDKYMTSIGQSFSDLVHDYENDEVTFTWNTKYVKDGYTYTSKTPYPALKQTNVYATNIKSAVFENCAVNGVMRITDLPAGKYTMTQGADKDGNPQTSWNSTLNKNVPVYYFEAYDNNNEQQLYMIYQGDSTYYSFRYDKDSDEWKHYSCLPIPSSYVTNIKTTSEVTHCNTNYSYPLNYEGITQEQRELYDYAVAITKEVYSSSSTGLKTIGDDPEVASKIEYYRNIFNQMAKFGYTTAAEMNIPTNGLNEGLKKSNSLLKDNNWFEQFLRQGKLQLKSYDVNERDFVITTIDQDAAIQEVPDERKIAKAEAEFNQAQEAIERKDKKFDLEIKKLDSEHNALQTEYESIKSVVDKNVEKSFNIFS